MKQVDAVAFHKIKSMREGKNDESDNFEMEILDEGAIDKSLIFPEQTLYWKTWKTIYEIINDEYFK